MRLGRDFLLKIMNDWLRQFLFTHTRMTKPDGRPLYAYKCSDKKYAELKTLTKETISLALRGRKADQVEALFCYYAAETFCREHEGGIWAWETIFKALGIVEPDYQYIKNWVGTGLNWWGRPLIEQNGRRRFLPTIACEGGLPLKLLQKESAAINQFFRAVLESYHAQSCGGFEMAELLSRQQGYRLPSSLRQDVVFHLGGELITAVVELQHEIGIVPNPVVALDEKVPDWKNRLPLRLEEQTAEVLFNGLVKRSGELLGASHARLRWRGKLQQTVSGWRIEKRLELPEKISGQQLSQWLGQESLPSRVRLLLTTSTGTEVIAWLTLSGGTAEMASYRREWLKREGLSLFDSAVMVSHALSLHDGQKEYLLNIPNGEPWGELPWLFVEKHNTGDLEFLAEGSAQTRAEQAWVLTPEQWIIKANESGHCDKRGNHLALKRSVFHVSGAVDFLTTDQERYRILCQATSDSTESYSIVGNVLNESINQHPVYIGLPRVSNNIAHYKTQWRPVNSAISWREGELDCAGKLWLRLQNAATNVEVFRRQVFVLPKGFRILATIGEGETTGSYRLSGLMGATVIIDSGQPLFKTAEGVEIICPLLQVTMLPNVIVSFHWSTGSLTINLPYPQRGALFEFAGQMLERDDCIPLDRLGGLRLFLQDHMGVKGYRLVGKLITTNSADAVLPCLQFSDRLPQFNSGRYETSLLIWQDRIASLLNSSRCLDAFVRLDVTSVQGECLARIQIARFDCFLEPDYSACLVSLSSDNIYRLGVGWQQRIHLEMIPLWAPASTPLLLEVNPERDACWSVPDDLPDGPWWIIGRDGDWARFRPLLWVANNKSLTMAEDTNISRLVAAIRESEREQREWLLVEVLQELGRNPDHPDWPRLFDLIRLSREFPASSLDVLTKLALFPETLTLALLKADDELFSCVWEFAEQMPFSWSLLPIHCWLNASRLYFKSLGDALGEMDANQDLVFSIFQQFRERTTARRGYWSALCDWLQEGLFSKRPLQNSLLQIARQLPTFFVEQIAQAEQDLQGRHDADEQWPQSVEVMQRTKLGLVDAEHQYLRLDARNRPVRCAPFVAARLSINSRVLMAEAVESESTELAQFDPFILSDNLIYELRLLRPFDTEWFDRVYSIALTVELSRLPLESTQ
ncbi:MAG: hypothetical protein RIR39_1612 [Pseudomonadota bacterium]